jgi:excisionase family DNA binding protein
MSELIGITREELSKVVSNAVSAALERTKTSDAEVLTCAQAAKYLGLHRDTLSKIARKAQFGSRVGNKWRFRRSELDAYLASMRNKCA